MRTSRIRHGNHLSTIGEGDSILPSFNRRTFLRGTGSAIAVAGAGVTSAVAAVSEPTAVPESEELQWLSDRLTDYLAERMAAEAEIARIADDWRDRWPLAPEDLLGPLVKGRGVDDDFWQVERNIAGKKLERDVSLLTRHLSKRMRAEPTEQKLAFYVRTRASIQDVLAKLQSRKPTGRTPKALARDRAWIIKAIASANAELDLLDKYEAATARVREQSGIDAAKARLAKADANVVSVREAISHAPACSPADLQTKAAVVRDELNEAKYDWISSFPGSALGRLHRLAFTAADGGAYS